MLEILVDDDPEVSVCLALDALKPGRVVLTILPAGASASLSRTQMRALITALRALEAAWQPEGV